MSEIIFMSHPLDDNTPSYGDRDSLKISPKSKIVNGLGANTSSLFFSNNHMGTHMDTPYHFCENGKKTLEYSAKEFYFSNVGIINHPCTSAKLIKSNDLDLNTIPLNIDFLFINTSFEKYREEKKYIHDNPGLHADLANVLRNKFLNLKGVGFDFISLTSWKFREEGRKSHKSFLCNKRSLLVIEDVSFKHLNTSQIDWTIISPLRTSDGNGGPVTIISKIK